MNSIDETARDLKSEFGLLELASIEALDQNGDYIVFDGLESIDDISDYAIFSVIVARNTLVGEKSGVLSRIDELRRDLFKFGAKQGEKIVFGAKAAFVTSTLYCVRLQIKIKIIGFIEP
ncbi:hypothetical protein CCAL12920_00725 [Campylobacter sp. RM12920]|uniref:Uncharacterized protein n=1 Tax=Campylobacter californiensis TaxID=1032243 RepID=A0ABD4JFI5_9BACT|nr:hypothetical protein [Campylobacter sp. RM12919]MBE2987424.1 hypothetical protein [Campylobacter sp. RM12920]MBE3022236.1 hypothetical protein [Campylobacter sp. 7477a]